MARLLKDNQAPRRLPHRGSAFLDTALLQSGLPARPHRRLQEAGSEKEGDVPPLQETPGSYSHPLPPSPLATPACQGTGKWGPAGYPVKTQAPYHLELRDDTGRYQTVLAWVVREDASEELSKSLSEVKEGAVQGSRGRASCAKPREVLTFLNQEQGWGAGWKPRSPQWLEGNRKRETW